MARLTRPVEVKFDDICNEAGLRVGRWPNDDALVLCFSPVTGKAVLHEPKCEDAKANRLHINVKEKIVTEVDAMLDRGIRVRGCSCLSWLYR